MKYRPEKSTDQTCVFTQDETTIVLQKEILFADIQNQFKSVGMLFRGSFSAAIPMNSTLVSRAIDAWDKAREEMENDNS